MTRTPPVPPDSESLARRIAALCVEKRGEDPVALDVRGIADYMDFMLIVSGRSARQNRAIADHVVRTLKPEKIRPLTRPGPEDAAWICLDFVDVVLHVFEPISRKHYDLELLWADAPVLPI